MGKEKEGNIQYTSTRSSSSTVSVLSMSTKENGRLRLKQNVFTRFITSASVGPRGRYRTRVRISGAMTALLTMWSNVYLSDTTHTTCAQLSSSARAARLPSHRTSKK